jgi:hypothetical protein
VANPLELLSPGHLEPSSFATNQRMSITSDGSDFHSMVKLVDPAPVTRRLGPETIGKGNVGREHRLLNSRKSAMKTGVKTSGIRRNQFAVPNGIDIITLCLDLQSSTPSLHQAKLESHAEYRRPY